MAKKRKSPARGSRALNATAETIGAALGQVAARLEAWKQQRAEIAGDIQKILHSAHGWLDGIGDARGRRGPSTSPAAAASRKGGRPKGYKMSEATKRKLRAAWKRRKAQSGGKVSE